MICRHCADAPMLCEREVRGLLYAADRHLIRLIWAWPEAKRTEYQEAFIQQQREGVRYLLGVVRGVLPTPPRAILLDDIPYALVGMRLALSSNI